MNAKLPRLRVKGSFFLLLSALLLADGQGILPAFLTACAVHELGHLLALYACGGRVAVLTLRASGAELQIENAGMLSYPAELFCVLAGPAAGVLAGVWAAHAGMTLAAGLNLSLAVFNLLPVRVLDGGQALYLSLAWLFSPAEAGRIVRVVSLLAVGCVFLNGLFLLPLIGPALLLTGLWLALVSLL